VATGPTADRVREAVFDILQSVVDLDGARVLDLFAGSGAMGIEALSRGAGAAVFVEHDRRALEAMRHNLAALGLEQRARMVRAEAVGWLASPRPAAQACFDLAFCDPPYRFGGWDALLRCLDAEVAVLETSRLVETGPGWEVSRSKRYGGTLVTVVRRAPSATSVANVPDRRAGPELTPEEKGTA
jgi:16S rRNA (guanine966-N2)-methyltransferase